MQRDFKILYLIGLILLFISFFLEWYVVQVYNSEGSLIAYWSYNPLFKWKTIFSESSSFNNNTRPKDLAISPLFPWIFIIFIVLSAYCVVFNDLENMKKIEKIQKYSYVNLFLLFLNIFYLFIFPAYYLLPNELYFPFVEINDEDLDCVYHYSIGPGYILQMIGFISIFPYIIFYYQTSLKFKSQKNSPNEMMGDYLEQIQEPIDMDKLIAQEEMKSRFGDISNDNIKDFNFTNKKTAKKRIP